MKKKTILAMVTQYLKDLSAVLNGDSQRNTIWGIKYSIYHIFLVYTKFILVRL